MKQILTILATSLICIGNSVFADTTENKPIPPRNGTIISLQEVPPSILMALIEHSGQPAFDFIDIKKDGHQEIYRGFWTTDNIRRNVQVTKQGTLIKSEEHVALDAVPENIRDIAKNYYPEGTLFDIEIEHVEIYDIAPAGDKTKHLYITPIGKIVEYRAP